MAVDVVHDWAPVYPHLGYAEPVEAIEWLTRAFGFRERVRMSAPDGSFITAKMETPGGGLIMVTGYSAEPGQWLRDRVPNTRVIAERPWPQRGHNITVMVEDVDAHHDRAATEGATIVNPPNETPWGLRVYSTIDPEGHMWEFVSVVNTMEPEAWGAVRID
jgi:uncharacterized glyoxalase superfamily protein PhnB